MRPVPLFFIVASVALALVLGVVVYLTFFQETTIKSDLRELRNDVRDGVHDAYDATKDAVKDATK
ncbi:hypothetical protein LBMAG53_09800 [Planctomycetota bacterium]|nr:hypothetical protein LBMAG53_09800 [Planctomycetota bacterium]